MNTPTGFLLTAIPGFSITAFAIAFCLTYWSKNVALRFGIVDRPTSRSSHNNPTPRLGGIGIIVTFFVCVAGVQAIPSFFSPFPGLNALLAGAFVVALFSLLDDAALIGSNTNYLISVLWKLTGQILAVGITVSFGPQLGGFRSFLQPFGLETVGQSLNILWILWMTNAYNFMDGIDGLAGLTAVIYGIFLALVAISQGSSSIAVICLILAASSLGFVWHNFPFARVFMGDSGSTFLGFTFGTLSLLMPDSAVSGNSFIPCILIFGIFIYDATFTLICRLMHKENIFRAHRDHLYQRLVRLGLTHRVVTLMYSIFSILLGCLSLIYLRVSGNLQVALCVLVLILLFSGTQAVCIAEKK